MAGISTSDPLFFDQFNPGITSQNQRHSFRGSTGNTDSAILQIWRTGVNLSHRQSIIACNLFSSCLPDFQNDYIYAFFADAVSSWTPHAVLTGIKNRYRESLRNSCRTFNRQRAASKGSG